MIGPHPQMVAPFLIDQGDAFQVDQARRLPASYLTDMFGTIRAQDQVLLDDVSRADRATTSAVMADDGTLIGVCVLHEKGMSGQELRALYVVPTYRSKGLGWGMFDLLLAHAGPDVYTVVATDSPGRRQLGQRGFVPAGTPPDGVPGYVRYARLNRPRTVTRA